MRTQFGATFNGRCLRNSWSFPGLVRMALGTSSTLRNAAGSSSQSCVESWLWEYEILAQVACCRVLRAHGADLHRQTRAGETPVRRVLRLGKRTYAKEVRSERTAIPSDLLHYSQHRQESHGWLTRPSNAF